MIQLNKITIEGYSNLLGPINIRFKGKGVRFLKAVNGEGKTTILSAIAWVFYGKTLKVGSTIDTWEHKRGPEHRGTKVDVIFHKDGHKYKITRCKDFRGQVEGKAGRNRLVLWINGEEYTDSMDKKDLQRHLINILGYNYELFINTTIFPQKITRFIELKGSQRREILEEIFNLTPITLGYKIAKDKYNELTAEATNLSAENAITEATITAKEDTQAALEKADEEKALNIKKNQTEVARLKALIPQDIKPPKDSTLEIRQEIQVIKQSEEYKDYQEAATDLVVNSKTLTNLRASRTSLEKQLSKTKYAKEGNCTVCKQDLKGKAHANVIKHFKEELVAIELKITKANANRGKLNKKVTAKGVLDNTIALKEAEKTKVDKKLADHKDQQWNNKVNQGLIDAAEKNLKDWEALNNSEEISTIILELGILRTTLETKENDLRRAQTKATAYEFVANKVFSKSGFKAYLLSIAVEEINKILEVYNQQTGFKVELIIADNAYRDVQAIIYIGGYPVIYQDLSGGQAQLVNASISLSLAEFMASKGTINFLALDEIFENLDKANAERIASIVETMGNHKEVWLITHRNDIVLPNSEIIYLEAEDKVIKELTI